MAKLKEVKEFLDKTIPLDLQDSRDNSGLQVGSLYKEIHKVMFSLSVTLKTIEEAKEKEVDLILTHHPLTISPIKSVTDFKYPEKIFFSLLSNNISVYAMHTNLDVSEMGPTKQISKRLNLTETEPIMTNPEYGIIGNLPEPMNQRELVRKLKSLLPKDVHRGIGFKPESIVKRVAICSGSGAFLIEEVSKRADIFITGDIKYHDALKAIDVGITVLDMGHFGTEKLFYLEIYDILKAKFPELDLIISETEDSPFEVL